MFSRAPQVARGRSTENENENGASLVFDQDDREGNTPLDWRTQGLVFRDFSRSYEDTIDRPEDRSIDDMIDKLSLFFVNSQDLDGYEDAWLIQIGAFPSLTMRRSLVMMLSEE